MAEINNFSKSIRKISVSSNDSISNESSSVPSSPRSSSPASSFTVQYKLAAPTARKGVWSGYATQDEFMSMHLR